MTGSICTDTSSREGTSPLNGSELTGVYLWGAGGKGVMCCNLLNGEHILGCIDRNPFKQGRFIPGTGHPVIAPADISPEKVRCILVENDVYFEEIEKEAHAIDGGIQVLSLNQLLGTVPE